MYTIRIYLVILAIALIDAAFYTTNQFDARNTLKFAKSDYKFNALFDDTKTGQQSPFYPIGRLEITSHNKNYVTNLEAFNVKIYLNSSDASYNVNELVQLDTKTLDVMFRTGVLSTSNLTSLKLNAYLVDQFTNNILSECSVTVEIAVSTNNSRNNTGRLKFKLDPYEVQIFENNAPNTFVLRVQAAGNDDESKSVTYNMLVGNTSSPPFQIKSDTGEIYVKRTLNREFRSFYQLVVQAVDTSGRNLSTTCTVNVRILAENDLNRPAFDQDTYNVTLAENSDFTKKPVILQVNAHDPDNTSVTYSLAGSLNDLNTFEVDSTLGSIRLVSKLNYDLKNSYKLTVIARNLGQPARFAYAKLNVFIRDVSVNPPVFNAPFYEFVLYENVPIGSNVGRVRAGSATNIPDTGKIVYSFDATSLAAAGDNFPFAIEPLNGTIFTIKRLSKTLRNGYEFYVNALDTSPTDEANSLSVLSSTVKVKIKILDVNDNVPEFSQKVYNLNVSEEASLGLPLLTLNVINRDMSSPLDYTIESIPPVQQSSTTTAEVFSIVRQTNNRVYLTLEKGYLNFKKKSTYELSVKVIDQDGLYSTTNIKINVLPNNNYMPRFTRDIYSFEVFENATVGSYIGSVTALGSSVTPAMFDNQIVYKLITNLIDTPDAASADFRLNEINGNLFVLNQLDREKYDQITLYVTATYKEKPTRSDHAIIKLKILDSNDNEPKFTRPYYEARVYANTPDGARLTRVEAVDPDTQSNGQVRYSFDADRQNQPLSIDAQTGVVRLEHNNFQHEEFLNITLVASDMGEPSLSGRSYLLVKFIAVLDNGPYFDANPVQFDLIEHRPVGTTVGFIKARDPNRGNQADIAYKLINNNDLFELKASGLFNSVLLVSKFTASLVDQSKPSNYSLIVRAFSNSMYTDCAIDVNVRGEDQSLASSLQVPNRFKLIFNNYRNYFLTEQVARVPVRASNINELNLNFRIVDPVGRQLINLNPESGEISLKSILNSNNQINASFEIAITDSNRRQEVRTTCELIVSMITDNLIAESVTLTLENIDLDTFLNFLYENFTNAILDALPQFKRSNIHVFNLDNSSFTGINVSLAVSYDYEKDIFMPASILKQLVYSNLATIERKLKISRIWVYEDKSCAVEPCLNYQHCLTSVKFSSANAYYFSSTRVQFRSISIGHDFTCSCPMGFTGTNISLMCDLEINLCYSNPCGSNGVCISLESSFVCVCDENYTGRMCEFNLKDAKCCESIVVSPSTPASLAGAIFFNSTQPATSSPPVGQCISNRAMSTQDLFGGYEHQQNAPRVCKGTSTCKNLILGGITCDQCDLEQSLSADLDETTSQAHYNSYCELRSRHFPADKNARLVLPGVNNRLRFRIKLSFATVNSNGYLFYNGRIDPTGADHVSLRIVDDRLVVAYTLGDPVVTEFALDRISVTDGKWRTVTLDYANYNFTLSLDDDNLDEVDACQLARNTNSSDECHRVSHQVTLPAKCAYQIETCFRYFDLNGPLLIGMGPQSQKKTPNYAGCVGDIYVNEKMFNLREDILHEENTQAGCPPKVDLCRKNAELLKSQCSKCIHVWSNQIKCECKNDQEQDFKQDELTCVKKSTSDEVISVDKNGYIVIDENRSLPDDQTDIDLRLTVRYQSNLQPYTSTIAYLRFNELKFFLLYDLVSSTLNFKCEHFNGEQYNLAKLNKHRLLDDDYWNSIRLTLTKTGLVILSVNDVYRVENQSSLVRDAVSTSFKLYIGGGSTEHDGIAGCMKNIRLNNNNSSLVYESVNTGSGCSNIGRSSSTECSWQFNQTTCNTGDLCKLACYNSGQCTVTSPGGEKALQCTCPAGYKGKYCQYETKKRFNLLETGQSSSNKCPAKWWGSGETGICGPCRCDESKNFSPDCNQTTGECSCKAKYYKKVNKFTREKRCVPCDCYLEGSTSLQCDTQTGQCKCLPGAGITGRRCDQCVSPFAEMTTGKGNQNQCRQLTASAQCPKAFKFNMWWPRTDFNSPSNTSCPRGASGLAYRSCDDANSGWSNNVDLSECQSVKLIDSQLLKWSHELSTNKSQLNAYQAFKLVEELTRIVSEAEQNDNEDVDDLDETSLPDMLATSGDTLYALDLIIIKNLTKSIIDYEIDNAPSFLFIQEKHFLKNLFTIIGRLLDKKYDLKLYQYIHKHQLANFQFYNGIYTDLIRSVDNYVKTILKFNENYSLNERIELELNNLLFEFKSASDGKPLSYAESTNGYLKYRITSQNEQELDASGLKKLSLISMNSASINLPNGLIVEQFTAVKDRQLSTNGSVTPIATAISSFKYRVVSNLLLLNVKSDQANSHGLVVEFFLTNNFDTIYDARQKTLNYRNLKTVKSDYTCVYLNRNLGLWTSIGARLLAYDAVNNLVKCSYDRVDEIYAVVTPTGTISNHNNVQPILFSIVFKLVMPLNLAVLFFTLVLLAALGKSGTPLTSIYANLCLNVFLLELIFFLGVNSNKSQIFCKFIAIMEHYFSLTAYLWMLLIAVHLYRMLTELRDINVSGSCAPVVYYLIGYVLPTLMVSLTLGIKNDVYTNYDSTITIFNYPIARLDCSSVFCWLNINQTNELFVVYLLPVVVMVFFSLVLLMLSCRELKKTNFKQTDISLVNRSLVSSFVLIPFKCLMSVFLLMFLQTSSSVQQVNTSLLNDESFIYQHLFLLFSFVFSSCVFILFVLVNRQVKCKFRLKWTQIKCKLLNGKFVLHDENNFMDSSKAKFNTNLAKSAPFDFSSTLKKQQLQMKQQQQDMEHVVNVAMMMDAVNKKYLIEYNDFQANTNTNSISTTTTTGSGGTLENSDDVNSQNMILPNHHFNSNNNNNNNTNQHYHHQQQLHQMQLANGYMSNLINTTNTESTTNESDFNYNYDFNKPVTMPNDSDLIPECDVVDVGKLLKTRNLYMTNTLERKNKQQLNVNGVGELTLSPSNILSKQIQFQSNFNNQREPNSDKMMFKNNQPEIDSQNRSMVMFWPNTIAECDTSYLEGGSEAYQTTTTNGNKLNQYMSNKNDAGLIPDLVSCSGLTHQQQQQQQQLTSQMRFPPNGNSFNTNSSSENTSDSSLLMNQNGMMGSYNIATSKAVNLEFIQTTASKTSPLVPIFSGNLIPNDDIDNETRV